MLRFWLPACLAAFLLLKPFGLAEAGNLAAGGQGTALAAPEDEASNAHELEYLETINLLESTLQQQQQQILRDEIQLAAYKQRISLLTDDNKQLTAANREIDGRVEQLQKDIAGLKAFTGYSTGKPASPDRILPALVVCAILGLLLIEAIFRRRRDP